ncbi:hypothetical protein ATG_06920 [Desulfurococcaceae archaeon AG1]|jgi:uncharacterized protein|nr:MAG: hypothetical protein DJ555_00080 [Desulfurococcaceae archaeon]GAY25489.1 hypothetical protein ATG_06920 [Desulfurococcaceae archaeon AG1]
MRLFKLAPHILVLLIILTAALQAGGNVVEIVGYSRVPALAVSMLDDGSYVGIVTWIDVKILKPGSGIVYVSTEPLSDIDLQASARAAVLIASYLAGKDPFKYDYLVSIKSSSPIVGGPSAGSAMVAAIYAALTNTSLDPFVAATGMILPDGLIGPVGGVPEKAIAAASDGFKVILVPWGQSNYTEVRYVRQSIGPVSIIRPTTVTINVNELVSKYGARVVEVATAEDLLYMFTNGAYKPIEAAKEPFLTASEERILSSAYGNLSALLSTIVSSTLRQASLIKDQKIVSNINSLITYSTRYNNESRDLYNRGLYYPALSSLFTSYYIARFAQNLANAYSSQDPVTYARDYISQVKNLVDAYRSLLSQYTAKSFYRVSEVYILPEVYGRLYDAWKNLNSSIASINNGDIIGSIYYASYAEARLKSIDVWLQLAVLPGTDEVSRDNVGKLASWIYSYAETSLAYLESLLSSIGYQNAAQQELEVVASHAASLLGSGDYLAAISLSAEVILNTTITIHNIFSINMTKLGEIVRGEVRRILADLGSGSPVSARLYAQMGDYLLERGQITQALSLYEQSLLILRIAKLLAQGSQVAVLSSAGEAAINETPASPAIVETTTNTVLPGTQTVQISRSGEVLPTLSTIMLIAIIVILLSIATYIYVRRKHHSLGQG